MSITSKHVPACMSAAILGAMLGLLCGCGGDPVEPVIPPSVTGDPSDQAAAVGETVTFSVAATGSGTILYQWRKNGVDIPDATDPSYTTPSLTSGDDGALFTCVVSSEYGSVESDAAAVVMSVPTITAQPANTTVLERDTASFSVTATGSGTISYQWQKDVVDVTGATAAGYTTPATALADDGAQFTCIVSNLAGDVTSAVATLTVNMAPPLITVHPADQTVAEGDTATFTVTAIGSGTVTYQWVLDSVDVSGATSASYTTPATTPSDSGGQFTCIVSNVAGDVTSDVATLTVVIPPGSIAWAKRAGGSSEARAFAVAALPDGSAVVTGFFNGDATFGLGEANVTPLTSAGDQDVFVARYNSDGTLAWAKRAGGTGRDEGRGVAVLSDDSAVVTGGFSGSAVFGLGEANVTTLTAASEGIFVARYNTDGTLAWAEGVAGGIGFGITALSDDSTMVTGSAFGSVVFGQGEGNETPLTCSGDDVFVARYGTDGLLAWAKRAGSTRPDGGSAIATLPGDSAVITGSFAWWSPFPDTQATFGPGEVNQTILEGDSDMFVARYNPGGTLAWAKRASAYAALFAGDDVAALSGGSTAVAGWFYGTAVFGPDGMNPTAVTAAGLGDIFVARYGSDGALAWVKRAGGTDGDHGRGVAALTDDSVVVTGYFRSTATFGEGEPNVTPLTSSGSEDVFIARHAPDGTLAWAKRAGGLGTDEGYAVVILPDGSILVVGCFSVTATFGEGGAHETTLTCPGSQDIFIARYNP